MLLVDDLAAFPLKSIFMIFREIHNAAMQELEQDGEKIRLELSQLYISLESGAINEAVFDERERVLLDRLDELDAREAEHSADDGAQEDVPSSAEEWESEEDEDDDDDDDDDVGEYEYLPYSES